MPFKQYSTKPSRVEAALLTDANIEQVAIWCGGRISREEKPGDPTDVAVRLHVPSLERHPPVACLGDYLVRDIDTGEFVVRSAVEFEADHFLVGVRTRASELETDG